MCLGGDVVAGSAAIFVGAELPGRRNRSFRSENVKKVSKIEIRHGVRFTEKKKKQIISEKFERK